MGPTDSLPDTGFAPDQAPDAVQPVASVELQLRTAELSLVRDAVRETVGVGAVESPPEGPQLLAQPQASVPIATSRVTLKRLRMADPSVPDIQHDDRIRVALVHYWTITKQVALHPEPGDPFCGPASHSSPNEGCLTPSPQLGPSVQSGLHPLRAPRFSPLSHSSKPWSTWPSPQCGPRAEQSGKQRPYSPVFCAAPSSQNSKRVVIPSPQV